MWRELEAPRRCVAIRRISQATEGTPWLSGNRVPQSTPRPVSYLLNLEAASDVGLDPEQLRGVLVAITPIIGTARVSVGQSQARRRACH
jgi:hypothetical protein